MNTSDEQANPENWLLGDYVGKDFHIILEISDHASLDVLQIAAENTDENGLPDISKLFGAPIETHSVSAWNLRSNNVDTAEAVAEFFSPQVCLTEFIDYMKRNTRLRGKLYYENRDIEASVVFSQWIPGMLEQQRIRMWSSEKNGNIPVSYEEYLRLEESGG